MCMVVEPNAGLPVNCVRFETDTSIPFVATEADHQPVGVFGDGVVIFLTHWAYVGRIRGYQRHTVD